MQTAGYNGARTVNKNLEKMDIPATPYFIAKTASSGCKTPLTIIGKLVMLFNQDIPSQVRDGSRDLTFIDLGK